MVHKEENNIELSEENNRDKCEIIIEGIADTVGYIESGLSSNFGIESIVYNKLIETIFTSMVKEIYDLFGKKITDSESKNIIDDISKKIIGKEFSKIYMPMISVYGHEADVRTCSELMRSSGRLLVDELSCSVFE